MARVAVAGFQHETNTFAPTKATWKDFYEGGGWPALQRGRDLPAAVAGANLPVAGALEALAELGHQPVPLVWAAATPSAHVTEEAFERIVGMVIEDLRKEGPFGGVYLPKDPKRRIPEPLRPLQRVTVFDAEVRYPRPAIPYRALPDDLLHALSGIFARDVRAPIPLAPGARSSTWRASTATPACCSCSGAGSPATWRRTGCATSSAAPR